MSRNEARYEARKRANKHGRIYFIVWSVEDHDLPGHHWHPADEYDLDTWYLGCADPVETVEPSNNA